VIPYPTLVALAVVGLSCLVNGCGLLLAGRARISGALLMLAGSALVAGTAVSRNGQPDLAATMVAAAAGLAGPLAMATYPELDARRLVDFLALVALAGAGAVLLAEQRAPVFVSAVATASGVILVAHTWWRIERADVGSRGPLLWMALALVAAALVCGVATFSAEGGTGQTSEVVVAAGISLLAIVPVAMYVGATRPELVDVRGLIVSTVVFAVAMTCYVSIFVGAVSFLEVLGGRRPVVGVLGVVGALAAATLHPLQVVLRGVVDALLFGERPDPLGAASHVADHISDDPVLALRAIREALVLPFAALRVDGAEVAVSGVPVTHTRTLSLALGRDTVGELEVGLRAGDLGLSPGDEHVLKLVAPLLAQTLRAMALTVDVQTSREQSVAALEEERRRLRRDLHDGLGPRLSGIAFTADAARNKLREDPDQAEALLRTLRAETTTAIQEIRHLVYAMRPPALDELGLVPALRQQADQLHTPDGRPLRVRLDASGLPALAAAVEVAAYRITVEALTNSARHSGSAEAVATLTVREDTLVIEVRDGGRPGDHWAPGVGLASMRERAAELGGTLSVSDHETLVRAVLPLGRRTHGSATGGAVPGSPPT
jgi:two-component system NarL family sensor kinase